MNTNREREYNDHTLANVEVKRIGNVFHHVVPIKEAIDTKYKWEDRNGVQYNIYVSPRHKVYFKKVNSRGKLVQYSVPNEVKDTILREMREEKWEEKLKKQS